MGKFLSCGGSKWKIWWLINFSGLCGFGYSIYEDVEKRLDQVGLEGKNHNMIVF